jgi:flagellar hook assembly protein FlgD
VVTSVEEERTNNLPPSFQLEQNYPNPFNPTTTIRFALPRETEVELKVYNVSGQEVATLVQEKLAAGTYTVQWNGKTNTGQPATSGMYLYRLRSENKLVSKKLLLLR